MKADRDIYNLLGLSFDAVTMEETATKIIDAIRSKRKLFLSTPNLNFLIAGQHDENFRKSVLHSDLSIADGMPIVFMCKLLDIPIRKRVAGSSLIDFLQDDDRCRKKPIKVFFFGGQDGIAEQAHEILNEKKCGLESVGYLNPGFGSVEDMSSDEIIDEINEAKADFIIVSLGAKKGQAWIENNRDSLNAYVISHLGAVVNFIAGNVKRAPDWVQNLHLEWFWRIKEEPELFSRYWNDGCAFLKLIFKNILPYRSLIKRHTTRSTPYILPVFKKRTVILKGDLTIEIRDSVIAMFNEIMKREGDFELDMTKVGYIDPSILAQLMLFNEEMESNGHKVTLINPNKLIKRIFDLNCLGFNIKTNKTK
ncbi:MAG: WecB/TagA/CpsF family glycosyltransferase [Kordiimonadaceae bacterium]|nr:WecB/TagA/CpsF family glycosyltransferase [Kordiimonadaceae bacterium]